MKIKLDKETKLFLLKSLKDGCLDTEQATELLIKNIIDVESPFDIMRKMHGIKPNQNEFN